MWWHNIVLLLKEGVNVPKKGALYARFDSNFGSVTVVIEIALCFVDFLLGLRAFVIIKV